MLETRELLSVAAVHARHPAEVRPLAKVARGELINGWYVGTGVWSPRGPMRGRNTLTASGAATQASAPGQSVDIGPITFTGGAAYKAAVQNGVTVGYNFTNGIGTLTFANGNKLHLEYTGALYESGTIYGYNWTGTIDGGTGQFAHAVGTFKSWGTYSIASGAFMTPSITLTLTRR
jgi:hypothetical protein